MLVLDTHVWIWLINGDEKIKNSNFLKIINKAGKKDSIKIPSICLWEFNMLAAKKRISLSQTPLNWINRALKAPGIAISHLTPEIAYESSNLPDNFHGDPADRIIVATTRVNNATLVTLDKEILNYSKKGHVKTLQ